MTSPRTRRRPRWWPLGLGTTIALVAAWAFITAWVGIRGSHPAYLITLVVELGAMAASYAEQERAELSGLLLYAAYPVASCHRPPNS